MQTSSTAKTKSVKSAPKSNVSNDAIVILKQDHAKVKKLFKEYEALSKKNDIEGKMAIANEICLELTVHAEAEEEVFYSVAKSATHEDDLLNEANVEHDTAKDLIAQIQDMQPDDPMYDAKVKVLGEYINHHVKEEETEMFPKVRKAKLDLQDLGKQLKSKENEIKSKLTSPDGEIDIQVLKQTSQQAAKAKH
jgi:hemerythrin superfamily protein